MPIAAHCRPTEPDSQIANERRRDPYQTLVLDDEDAAWLEALHERLLSEWAPSDAVTRHLVWRLATAMWRSGRADRLEREVFAEPWQPERLNAILSYRSHQRREMSESLRLLADRSRNVEPSEGQRSTAADRMAVVEAATIQDERSATEVVRAGLERLLNAADAQRPIDLGCNNLRSPHCSEPANGNERGTLPEAAPLHP
jgi:hypothetical protein